MELFPVAEPTINPKEISEILEKIIAGFRRYTQIVPNKVCVYPR